MENYKMKYISTGKYIEWFWELYNINPDSEVLILLWLYFKQIIETRRSTRSPQRYRRESDEEMVNMIIDKCHIKHLMKWKAERVLKNADKFLLFLTEWNKF